MAQVELSSWKRGYRRLARVVLAWPVSPRIFAALVAALRAVRLLPRPERRDPARLENIILCHPYASVGDLVLLIPLIERMRRQWPAAHIDIAVGRGADELLAGVEGLRHRIVCDSRLHENPLMQRYQRVLLFLRQFRREFRRLDYDLAIAPRWGAIETWPAIYFAYLTGATRRIGYSADVDHGDPALDRLLTTAVSGGANEHETARNLKLLSRAGLASAEPDDETAVARRIQALARLAGMTTPLHLEQAIKPGSRYVVLSPGATAPFRIWPAEFMAQAADEIHRQTGLCFYVVGSWKDKSLCDEIAARHPEYTTSLAGQTSLRELVRLLAGADLFLGMDSGTAHLAGALGIPTVVISPFPSTCSQDHPNSPRRFRPCGPAVRVLQPTHALPPCQPTCSRPEPHCIRQITPEAVVNTILGMLDPSGPDGARANRFQANPL